MDAVLQRLTRIETLLGSMATAESFARLEERVAHIDRQMPQVARNAIAEARTHGWHEAKEDEEKDRRGSYSIWISALALIVSTYVAIAATIMDGGPK